jgi:hypothetical protein
MGLVLVVVGLVLVLLSPLFLAIGVVWIFNSRRARKRDPAARARWQSEVDASKARHNRARNINQNNPYSTWYQGR